MERELKTLRRSRLMNYSEFRSMTTSLERYYKDVKLAMMLGRKGTGSKEMDLRPYLYDEGDSYDKPFYNTLLKMLYEVATSTYYDKQYEDLKKIHNWYRANKKLITSPPNVPIPEPQTPTPEIVQSTNSPDIQDEESNADKEEQEKFKKVPKLHLRPKTAPPIESKGGIRYVTWNEAQLKKGCKRPSSGKSELKYHSREHYAREQVAKSLKISQIGFNDKNKSDKLMIHRPLYGDRPLFGDRPLYGDRPGTAPPNITKLRLKDSDSLDSFVLRPYMSTPAPVSSPINSPMTSPRDSPVSFRAKSPQLSANFSPRLAKDPSFKVNVRLPKEHRDKHDNAENDSIPDDISDKENSQENGTVHQDLPSKLPAPQSVPQNASSTDLDQILKNQIREEKLLEEQHDLLQKKLLHDYEKYARECAAMETERQMNVEVVDGQVAIQPASSSSPSPVMTYDLSSPQIIPSYNRVYSKSKDTHARSKSTEQPVHMQSGYSPARHVRHSTIPAYKPADQPFNVNMVLDMVTPIGMQMEHDRERFNGYMAPGMKQPSSSISQPTRPTKTNQDPVPLWETSSSHPSINGSLQDMDSPRSAVQTPLEIKANEPELATERSERDYKVHFQQDKSKDETCKCYKTSGPVYPDTIRYQWTDDGFGGMTYLKKLKSPLSPRTPRKKNASPQTPRSDQFPIPTGSRSLGKRTLASLMLVRQLGESDRRDSDRFGGTSDKSTTSTPVAAPPPDPVEQKYQVEYMSICQPVGPKLGETDRPSTVAWYLQGDHGLYRDPSMRSESDEIRIKREVRIPQDRSLMIEGRHIGVDHNDTETTTQDKTPDKPDSNKDDAETNTSPKKTPKSTPGSATESIKQDKSSLRPTSSSPRRPSSPTTSENRHISIPTGKGFGTASRPCSARSDRSEKKYTFSVKQFNHFCWPDEALLTDDVIRQREVWAAVNIQRIFRGFMARQYYHNLRDSERERQRRAALTLQSHVRGFLTRKLMEDKMKQYTPSTRTKEWARQYKEDLKMRESARAQKKNLVLIKLNKEAGKQDENIKQVTAHQNIYDIYHPLIEGPTKAEMKAAAITIQRYFRGWFVRRMYQKVKTKALKRTLSFNKFIKGYQSLLHRIQKRYGVKDPTTNLQFNELMEYVERLNKYEIAFEKFAVNGLLSYNDIKEYFKAVGHSPSQKEIDEAIEIVTKSSPKGKSLTKAEAVEILFQIYVPKGTGLKLSDVRKSTWLNPLNDGQDIMQLLSKKDLEETNLAKCLALVANAGSENEAIQDLLRPASVGKKSEKKADKKGRRVTLAQYPLRPSSSSSSRRPSKSSKSKK